MFPTTERALMVMIMTHYHKKRELLWCERRHYRSIGEVAKLEGWWQHMRKKERKSK
jgi:hypothetical protein